MSNYLAARTNPSSSLWEAKRRVLNLYREWLREAPHMVRTFPLDMSIPSVRSRIRREFEKYRHVASLPVIDNLIFRGTQELIETQQKWKQKTHILLYMDEEERILEKENQRLSMRVINPIGSKSSHHQEKAFLSNSLPPVEWERRESFHREKMVDIANQHSSSDLGDTSSSSSTSNRTASPSTKPISIFLQQFLSNGGPQ